MLAMLSDFEIDLVSGARMPAISAFNHISQAFNTGGTSVGSFYSSISVSTSVTAAPGSTVSVTNNVNIYIDVGSNGGVRI